MNWLLSPTLWRTIAVAAVLAGLAWVYHLWADHQREIGRTGVRTEWQADKLARAEQNRLILMARDKESTRLQASSDKERQALYAKNRSIDLERDELLKRLRNRPDRPADRGDGVPSVAGAGAAGAGSTGASLYAPDARFLVGESARADRLRLALQSCRAAYSRAQGAVNQD